METTQLLAAIDEEISRLTQARSLLAGGALKVQSGSSVSSGRRALSPEARKRIADAQKKRGAKVKKAAR
jgi:hypothetical protein